MNRKGLLVALIHVAIVLSLGLKLQYDRLTLPRVWVRTLPIDPEEPIRGRYVGLRLVVPLQGTLPVRDRGVRLVVRNGSLVAIPSSAGLPAFLHGDNRVVLSDRLAFFISERIADPSRRPPGEELWADVTVPTNGPPRPVRLGVMRDGRLFPIR